MTVEKVWFVSEVTSAGSDRGDRDARQARDVEREPSEEQEEGNREEHRSEGSDAPGTEQSSASAEARRLAAALAALGVTTGEQDAVVMTVLVSVVPHGPGLALEARVVIAVPPEYVSWAQARPQQLRRDGSEDGRAAGQNGGSFGCSSPPYGAVQGGPIADVGPCRRRSKTRP